jgi:hypothetical protein
MAGLFWRARWAWKHTKLGRREILVAILTGCIYVAGWWRFRWGPEVRPDAWALISAALALALLWVLEFGSHFVRARIEQKREFRAQTAGRMGPRSIADPVAEAMKQRLKTEPNGDIRISYVPADPESYNLATQLQKVLIGGDWKIASFEAEMHVGPADIGLLIEVQNADPAPCQAVALKTILEEAGLAVRLEVGNPIWPEDMVCLGVGSKPLA